MGGAFPELPISAVGVAEFQDRTDERHAATHHVGPRPARGCRRGKCHRPRRCLDCWYSRFLGRARALRKWPSDHSGIWEIRGRTRGIESVRSLHAEPRRRRCTVLGEVPQRAVSNRSQTQRRRSRSATRKRRQPWPVARARCYSSVTASAGRGLRRRGIARCARSRTSCPP